ncbi:MAG TPA: hypothetical protein PKL08_16310 [Thermoanaerobaculaceae bacterium]|nr:hypothetical protein [Thermoanaerobaculaceae bacterium]
MQLQYGDSAARLVSGRVAEPVANHTALRATPTKRAKNGMLALVMTDNSVWQFNDTSVLTDDGLLVVRPSDGGTGAWLRVPGGAKISIPITFATADAAALLTLQAGQELLLQEIFWEVTADWTGGASSTIGVSSNKASYNTKGDLLGGAAGSLAAALTAAGTPNFGTIGAGYDTLAKRRIIFKVGDVIRHDRITSAFTAGTGRVILAANILKNAGA